MYVAQDNSHIELLLLHQAVPPDPENMDAAPVIIGLIVAVATMTFLVILSVLAILVCIKRKCTSESYLSHRRARSHSTVGTCGSRIRDWGAIRHVPY